MSEYLKNNLLCAVITVLLIPFIINAADSSIYGRSKNNKPSPNNNPSTLPFYLGKLAKVNDKVNNGNKKREKRQNVADQQLAGLTTPPAINTFEENRPLHHRDAKASAQLQRLAMKESARPLAFSITPPAINTSEENRPLHHRAAKASAQLQRLAMKESARPLAFSITPPAINTSEENRPLHHRAAKASAQLRRITMEESTQQLAFSITPPAINITKEKRPLHHRTVRESAQHHRPYSHTKTPKKIVRSIGNNIGYNSVIAHRYFLDYNEGKLIHTVNNMEQEMIKKIPVIQDPRFLLKHNYHIGPNNAPIKQSRTPSTASKAINSQPGQPHNVPLVINRKTKWRNHPSDKVFNLLLKQMHFVDYNEEKAFRFLLDQKKDEKGQNFSVYTPGFLLEIPVNNTQENAVLQPLSLAFFEQEELNLITKPQHAPTRPDIKIRHRRISQNDPNQKNTNYLQNVLIKQEFIIDYDEDKAYVVLYRIPTKPIPMSMSTPATAQPEIFRNQNPHDRQYNRLPPGMKSATAHPNYKLMDENLRKKLPPLATKEQLQYNIILENEVYPKGMGKVLNFYCQKKMPCYRIDEKDNKHIYYTCVHGGYCYEIDIDDYDTL